LWWSLWWYVDGQRISGSSHSSHHIRISTNCSKNILYSKWKRCLYQAPFYFAHKTYLQNESTSNPRVFLWQVISFHTDLLLIGFIVSEEIEYSQYCMRPLNEHTSLGQIVCKLCVRSIIITKDNDNKELNLNKSVYV
jgi:hypothetical protein